MSREISALRRGFLKALPIVLGVLPFGIAYGAAAAQHMPWWGGMGMSVIVFAGSAQFIAVGLIAQGAAPLSIIITTALVNLRYVLMSSALSPVLRKKGARWQALLAFFVVDETFAVSSVEFDMVRPPHTRRVRTRIRTLGQFHRLAGSFDSISPGRSG